jgi:hypothetical protein
MQEVLLAHDPTFLHRLSPALGHAAMLATNAGKASHRANSMDSRAAQRVSGLPADLLREWDC